MSTGMMFSYFYQTLHGNVPLVLITMSVVVNQRSLNQLAILCIGVLLPGIFLMVDVGLGEICGVPSGEPKLCSVG